jgi:hypothetical protein
LAIFKTWPEWTRPTRAPCLGWIACGIDNSLECKSVAPFLGLDI